jgi:hypothetical protein
MTTALIVAAELKERRKHWIGGIPTPADIDATVTHLAHRLKLSPDTLAACEEAGQRLEAQFEALPLQNSDGTLSEVHPKSVWTCFEGPAGL